LTGNEWKVEVYKTMEKKKVKLSMKAEIKNVNKYNSL